MTKALLLIIHRNSSQTTKNLIILSIYNISRNVYKIIKYELVHNEQVESIPTLQLKRRCITESTKSLIDMSTMIGSYLRDDEYNSIKIKVYANLRFNKTWMLNPRNERKCIRLTTKIILYIENYFKRNMVRRVAHINMSAITDSNINLLIHQEEDNQEIVIGNDVSYDNYEEEYTEDMLYQAMIEFRDKNAYLETRMKKKKKQKTLLTSACERLRSEKTNIEERLRNTTIENNKDAIRYRIMLKRIEFLNINMDNRNNTIRELQCAARITIELNERNEILEEAIESTNTELELIKQENIELHIEKRNLTKQNEEVVELLHVSQTENDRRDERIRQLDGQLINISTLESSLENQRMKKRRYKDERNELMLEKDQEIDSLEKQVNVLKERIRLYENLTTNLRDQLQADICV